MIAVSLFFGVVVVIGGGDTVTAAEKFLDLKDIDYICTAGGAMVRYLSGKKLPLIEAMEKAYARDIRPKQPITDSEIKS